MPVEGELSKGPTTPHPTRPLAQFRASAQAEAVLSVSGTTRPNHALIGRLGGLAKSSKHDGVEGTSAARAAFIRRFLDEQPTDLPEAERLRRAEAARRLHYAKLALKSAEARRRRKAGVA